MSVTSIHPTAPEVETSDSRVTPEETPGRQGGRQTVHSPRTSSEPENSVQPVTLLSGDVDRGQGGLSEYTLRCPMFRESRRPRLPSPSTGPGRSGLSHLLYRGHPWG